MFLFILGIYLGVELLGHMVILYLTFEERLDCFPKQLHHFTCLSAAYEGSNFSDTCYLFILLFFYYSHPRGYEVISHCGFDFHFPND